MRIYFTALLFLLLTSFAWNVTAQEAPPAPVRYEYVMMAIDEPTLGGPPWLRIYYGNGKVEDFGKAGSIWPGREGSLRNLDLTVTALNHLASQGYEVFRVIENDRSAEDSIRQRYLLRRVIPN
jgi:hypothetical protein